MAGLAGMIVTQELVLWIRVEERRLARLSGSEARRRGCSERREGVGDHRTVGCCDRREGLVEEGDKTRLLRAGIVKRVIVDHDEHAAEAGRTQTIEDGIHVRAD